MLKFDYDCIACGHELRDVKQSVHDKPLKRCPNCRKHKLERVILDAPYGSVVGEPTTLKHLADRNTKKMGKLELEARTHEEKLRRNRGKPPPERPFWRDSDKVDLSIVSSPEAAQQYIKTGYKPKRKKNG